MTTAVSTPALRLALQGRAAFADLPAPSTLRRWVGLALAGNTVAREAELTLRFVGAREGRKLNRDYRGRDYATNVLTFDYTRAPQLAADIVICVPVVRREAREQDKPWRAHLAHLVVHGTLHALGMDHQTERQARVMERREVEILARLGLPDPYQTPTPSLTGKTKRGSKRTLTSLT